MKTREKPRSRSPHPRSRSRDKLLDKNSKNIFDPVIKYHESTPEKVLMIK
jgi:hypothetical protein